MQRSQNIVRAAVYMGPRSLDLLHQPYVRLSEMLIGVAIDSRPFNVPITDPPTDRKYLLYTAFVYNGTVWLGTEHRAKRYREIGYPHRLVMCDTHGVECTFHHGQFHCCVCKGKPDNYRVEFLNSTKPYPADTVAHRLLHGHVGGRPSRLVVDANPRTPGVVDIPIIEYLDGAFLNQTVGAFDPPQVLITDDDPIDYNENWLMRKAFSVVRGSDYLQCQIIPPRARSFRCLTSTGEATCRPEEVTSMEFTMRDGSISYSTLIPGFTRIVSFSGCVDDLFHGETGMWQSTEGTWRHVPDWATFQAKYPATADAVVEELRSEVLVDDVLRNSVAVDALYCKAISSAAVAWIKPTVDTQLVDAKFLSGSLVPYTRTENAEKFALGEGRIGWDFRSMPGHWRPRFGRTYGRRDDQRPQHISNAAQKPVSEFSRQTTQSKPQQVPAGIPNMPEGFPLTDLQKSYYPAAFEAMKLELAGNDTRLWAREAVARLRAGYVPPQAPVDSAYDEYAALPNSSTPEDDNPRNLPVLAIAGLGHANHEMEE